MSRRVFGMSVFLIGSVAASAGDLIPYHRRAIVRCGLSPCYQYQPRNLSQAQVGETSGVLTLRLADALPDSTQLVSDSRRRLRLWQGGDVLKVDHCSISKVAVWIDESGAWSANLQALQDPYRTNGPDRQATPAARFLRNGFHVTVRAYGMAKVADPNRTAPVGQPLLFCIPLQSFWVNRDSTERFSDSGNLAPNDLQRLPLVDRLEVELRYE